MRSVPRAADQMHTIAAFAIEDRVDFRFMDFRASMGADPLFISAAAPADWSPSEPWPPARRVRGHKDSHDRDFFRQEVLQSSETARYFTAIYPALERALQDLHDTFATKATSPLREIAAFVVSVPGVVLSEDTVVQLPTWNWLMESEVQWQRPGGDDLIRHFSFRQVIRELIDRIAPKDQFAADDTRLREPLTVINDTTACATAAYFYAKRDYASHHHSMFVRAHFGVNASFLQNGAFGRGADHSEAGHVYPSVHPLDELHHFPGTCPYHGGCIEGMMTPRAFRERARPTIKGVTPFEGWPEIYEKATAGLEGEARDMAMFHALIRGKPDAPPNSVGQEIAAFYIAQLVHAALLLPPAPDKVFIGGRFATEEIIAKVREFVSMWIAGYPGRESLLGNLTNTILRANYDGRRYVELSGALLYAHARASDTHPDGPLVNLARAAREMALEGNRKPSTG